MRRATTSRDRQGGARRSGEVVRARRKHLDLTQEDVEGALRRNVVGHVERATRGPSLTLLPRLARGLDWTGAELIAATERRMVERADEARPD